MINNTKIDIELLVKTLADKVIPNMTSIMETF